jgi:RNA polymerase sigma-70 factor (ECF subfamily)
MNDDLATLVAATQQGDRLAYAALLRDVMPLLRDVLRRRLRFASTADRDDVMQEVLLSMHKALGTYDPQRPFIPWLTAIVRNRIVDRARRYSRVSAIEVVVDDWASVDTVEGCDRTKTEYFNLEALWRAMSRLPRAQRIAIELLRIRQLPVREAASIAGVSAGALRVSVHRAVKKLRSSLN